MNRNAFFVRMLAGGLALLLFSMVLPTQRAAAQNTINVLFYAINESADRFDDVENKIAPNGNFNITRITSGTPTLATLQAYDVVVVWNVSAFPDSTTLGDNLADYVDGGGSVVNMYFSVDSARAIGGRWASQGYDSITPGTAAPSAALTLSPVLPSHPMLNGVTSFSGGKASFHAQGTVPFAATRVANWSNGQPLLAYQTYIQSCVATLNMYPPSSDSPDGSTFWDASTDGDVLMANVFTYVGNNCTSVVAEDDSYEATFETTLVVNLESVLDNDTGAASVVPASGEATLADSFYDIDANGNFTYDPPPNTFGTTDSFTYTARNGDGSVTDTATVTITIIDQPPVAQDDSYVTVSGGTVEITDAAQGVLDNDSDPEFVTLTVLADSGQSTNLGTYTMATDGTFTYTAPSNFSGEDSFQYTATDGVNEVSATVTISVSAFILNMDTYETDFETQLVVPDVQGVLANDDGPTAVTVVNDGTTSLGGSYSINANGGFTYDPPNGQVGDDDVFSYEATDGVNVGTGQVRITILNDPPIPVDDSYAILVDTTLTVPEPGLFANDIDPEGLTLTRGGSTPGSGTTTEGGSYNLTIFGGLTYTPPAGFTGEDTFTYTISDDVDESIDSATVTITVSPFDVNDDTYETPFETQLVVPDVQGVLQNDAGPTKVDALSGEPTTQGGTVNLNADGSFTYTPPDNFFNGTDTFVYTGRNADDTASDTATVTITVPNDVPVANADAYNTTLNTMITVSAANGVLANDTDVQLTAGVPGVTLTASAGTTTAEGGTLSLATDGSFDYTPATNFSGTDTFDYTLSDGIDSTTGTVTITIAANTPPIAVNDSYTAVIGDPLIINMANGVLANDTDNEGDNLTALLDQTTSKGTLSLSDNGSFTYTPTPGQTGTDTFTYFANDGTVNSNTPATVTITLEVDPADGPLRLYPFNTQTVNAASWEGPNFTFQHQDGVDWYRVWIGRVINGRYSNTYVYKWYAALPTSASLGNATPICSTLTGVCTVPDAVWAANGEYAFFITTWTEGETKADIAANWTETRFTVQFDPPPTTVNVTSPQSGVTLTTGPTQITWDYDPDVLWYRVWLGNAAYTFKIEYRWVDASEDCDINTLTCTLDLTGKVFPTALYEMYFQVWGPGGFLKWGGVNAGQPFSFIVNNG